MKLPRGTRRLYCICLHLAVGASIWGYNIGILSSILVHPGWREAMHDPTPASRGLVTGIYYLGTLLSHVLLSHPLADRLGRRHAAMMGTGTLCLGAICMASAHGGAAVAIMALGRWTCGLGVGVVSTTVPLYQTEVSPARQRGRLVTVNHVGFVAGLAAGLWTGYAMAFWTSDAGRYWAWRDSVLVQCGPALVFTGGLFFLPETPRWLLEKGDADGASKVLRYLRQDTVPAEAITHELHAIGADVESRHAAGATNLFRDAGLRARLWRAFLLHFMAQMCGATAIKYYLPTLLEALGLERRTALLAGAAEMTIKIATSIVDMWAIDRFGRRTCLTGGSLIMGTAMLVNGLLPIMYPGNRSKAADVICISFIFIYAMGYSLGLGPAAWVYSSEIFPTSVRAKGLNFAAAGGSVGSVLASQIWPVGNARLGSGIYFFFMVINFTCVPTIWLLYPETKGIELEDMERLFATSEHTDATDAVDRGTEDVGEYRNTSSSATPNDENESLLS
ncbi:General substrate transporter [Metarhizium album ARSEF 1941]|uniref:General substrate transporter n=1 Tax=Metarhizium album (strain ARSEF 1941) TaxID=1081103 RepID=A0A0B2X8D1_METAS|nr:General substrate transporter [Metarhizium album ARSEF 1941]KHO01571.1 General substrate transporter [Metarhizium album ARSEF 1941]